MKISKKPLPRNNLGLYIDQLWRVFTLMESKEEIRLLLRDLLSNTELVMLAKRFQIAQLLLLGAEYSFIRKELSVSDSTIGTVSRWLQNYGEGYRLASARLEKARIRKKDKGISKVLLPDSGARVLAHLITLGARGIESQAKKIRKRRSARSL